MIEKLKTIGKVVGFTTTTIVGAVGLGTTIAHIINKDDESDEEEFVEFVEFEEVEDEDEDENDEDEI